MSQFFQLGRKGMVHGLIGLIFGVSILDMLLKREDFPFAAYTMYSWIHRGMDRATGLSAPGAPSERRYGSIAIRLVTSKQVELKIDPSWIAPLDLARLHYGFNEALRGSSSVELERKMRETLRAVRTHQADLQAIRIYKVTGELLKEVYAE
jgi:hypothetical protein